MTELVLLIFFVLLVIFILFFSLSTRGREMMFGGKIVKSWDGLSSKRKIVTCRVKVHALDVTPTTRLVGPEISAATFGSYQMLPISLPAAEARELARLIEEAANYSTAEKSNPAGKPA